MPRNDASRSDQASEIKHPMTGGKRPGRDPAAPKRTSAAPVVPSSKGRARVAKGKATGLRFK